MNRKKQKKWGGPTDTPNACYCMAHQELSILTTQKTKIEEDCIYPAKGQWTWDKSWAAVPPLKPLLRTHRVHIFSYSGRQKCKMSLQVPIPVFTPLPLSVGGTWEYAGMVPLVITLHYMAKVVTYSLPQLLYKTLVVNWRETLLLALKEQAAILWEAHWPGPGVSLQELRVAHN